MKFQGSVSLGDPVLLDKIDKLFACNVGSYIDLPQLVVVGDQSSGKSSVLEGLTGIPFPRESSLCTRFATQISFRRSKQESLNISIIPDGDSAPDRQSQLEAWKRADVKDLTSQSFESIIFDAQDVMGIGKDRTFTNDLLKIELTGPEREHLSVVDVPGIFRKVTKGVTTDDDMRLVSRMVHSYMANPRSVMLTVIPANVDIATQDILTIAEDFDPDGQRTLGVLTKPDLVDKGAEGNVRDLLEDRAHVLTLGWHVVRNLGKKQIEDNEDRHTVEKSFFKNSAAWSGLEEGKVGIAALQVRMQQLLSNLIRKEFPKVRADLNKVLKECCEKLRSLGQDRETTGQQTRYLLHLATSFQRMTGEALSTTYAAHDIFEKDDDLRLATSVVSLNDRFAETMRSTGHTLEFDSPNANPTNTISNHTVPLGSIAENKNPPATSSEDGAPSVQKQKSDKKGIATRTNKTPPEIEDLLADNTHIARPKSHRIIERLQETYRASRGFEIGTFQPSILSDTMKKQSRNWEPIALGYVSDVISLVHTFIGKLLDVVCTDQHVCTALKDAMYDQLVEKYNAAINHVEFLLQVERNEVPMTEDKGFYDSLNGNSKKREETNKASEVKSDSGIVSPEPEKLDNAKNIALHIHDTLQSYYKVACMRFVDNVCSQAAGHFLVTGPPNVTPLGLFSAEFVADLDHEELESIAGEDLGTRRLRQKLRKEISDLEAGKKCLV